VECGDILFKIADTCKQGVGCATSVSVSGTMLGFLKVKTSVVSKLVVKCLELCINILRVRKK